MIRRLDPVRLMTNLPQITVIGNQVRLSRTDLRYNITLICCGLLFAFHPTLFGIKLSKMR